MITIKDIARLANVSKSTVSRVINNYPDVNKETKERIIKIMQKNNYWPKTVARSLSTNKSYTIGLFVPTNMNNFFFREVIQGIEYTLGDLGYDILYFTHQKSVKYYIDTGIKFNFVEKSIDKHVDGLIMLGFNSTNMERFQDLVDSDIPTVFIDIKFESKRSSYVTSNNYDGACKAVKYLYDLGHRDIGILLGKPEVQPCTERYQGSLETFKKLGLNINKDWVFRLEYLHEEGYQAMKKILAMSKKPTAIFAEDMIAIGVIQAIRDAGFSVPEDFSVMGFDNIELSSHYQLTTINQDQYAMGAVASETLVKIINREPFCPSILPVELLVRKTCQTHNSC